MCVVCGCVCVCVVLISFWQANVLQHSYAIFRLQKTLMIQDIDILHTVVENFAVTY